MGMCINIYIDPSKRCVNASLFLTISYISSESDCLQPINYFSSSTKTELFQQNKMSEYFYKKFKKRFFGGSSISAYIKRIVVQIIQKIIHKNDSIIFENKSY